MLYFSRVPIDPERLDLAQVERLQRFKERTYPNSLTETYKSIIEFRDKFSKQLELKVRELQRAQNSGYPAVTLAFLSMETGESLGNSLTVTAIDPIVSDLDAEKASAENDRARGRIQSTVDRHTHETRALPIAFTLTNTSSSSIRDLYVEMVIRASNTRLEVAEAQNRVSRVAEWYFMDDVARKITELEDQGLRKAPDGSWKLHFEIGSIQPQRSRLVKPVLLVTTNATTTVGFTATVFADGFAQPVELKATLDVRVEQRTVSVRELVGDVNLTVARVDTGQYL